MENNMDEQKTLEYIQVIVEYLNAEIGIMKKGLKKRSKEAKTVRPMLKCILMWLEREHGKYEHIAVNMQVQHKFTNVLGKRLAKDINVVVKPRKEKA